MKKESYLQTRRSDKPTYVVQYAKGQLPPTAPPQNSKDPRSQNNPIKGYTYGDVISSSRDKSHNMSGRQHSDQKSTRAKQSSHSVSEDPERKGIVGLSSKAKHPNHQTRRVSEEYFGGERHFKQQNHYNTSSQGNMALNTQKNKTLNSPSSKRLEKNNSVNTLGEYRHLHQKLNTLENKILNMRSNLQKKKQDKKRFLQAQIRDRKERERQMREESERRDRATRQKQESQRRERENRQRRNRQSRIREQETRRRQDDLRKREQEFRKIQQAPGKFKKHEQTQESSPLRGLVTQVPQHKQLRHFDFNPYSPRNNIYYVSEIVKAYKQQKSIVREHLLSSMHLLKTMDGMKRPTMFEIAAKNVNLPKKQFYKDKKTVVFDLDQTLIHCNDNTSVPYDIKVPIKFPTGQVAQAGINIRPYAQQILRKLSTNFQIIVFTASHSCYANVVLDALDPQNRYIQHRLFRQHCYSSPDGMFIKDLRIINRPLSEMVLVDNAAYSYAFQVQNGIPIIPYYEGRIDYQLSSLEKYLESLIFQKDVRQANRKTFKLQQYKNYDDPDKLVKDLYNGR